MKKILILVTMSLLLISCQKFLDIMPKDKAYGKELFQTRNGFEVALAGIYNDLNSTALFGKELKFGLLEVLVGSYNEISNSSHPYYRAYRFEYNHPRFLNYSDAIWEGLYKVINQTNAILEQVDNIKDDPYYSLVKGEALGIRALCHFQLLKLYGPVISEEGLQAQAIPYRDAVSFTATKFGTAREVIDKLNLDLSEAREILANDPIRTSSRIADLNESRNAHYSSLRDRRGNRINYFAIVGFQSLVAQWEGELQKAAGYAEELIEEFDRNAIITLAGPDEMNNEWNRRTPMENVFALINQNLRTSALTCFPEVGGGASVSSASHLFANYNWLGTNLYNSSQYGSSRDFRYSLGTWFQFAGSVGRHMVIKYQFRSTITMHSSELQAGMFETKIISLHQLYMIAAEYYAVADKQKALAYLNKIRNTRGLISDIPFTEHISEQTVKDLVFAEMRKEGFAEGYLFTEYKRLFKDIDRSRAAVKVSKEIFKFPIPIDEQIYNPF